MQNTKFSLLGIPLDLGAENLGVDVGPDAFRSLKIVEKLERAGLTIEDVGNVECRPRQGLTVGDSKLRYLDEIVRVSEESAKLVAEHVKQGDKVIALGGDHSVCLGTISGAAAALGERLGLVYIDAHGDINTTETTLTGNIHGMPLASLMGFGDERLQNVLTKTRKISPENLLHIGGNDFDPGEIEMVKREHLNCFMTFDMLADGLRALFKMIDDRALASVFASTTFFVFSAVVVYLELKFADAKKYFSIWSTLAFILFCILPIVLIRIKSWGSNFELEQLAGISGSQWHKISNYAFMVMLVSYFADSLIESFRSKKSTK